MKKIIVQSLFMLLFATATMSAQTTFKRVTTSFSVDTVSTSSSVDTLTFTAATLPAQCYYEWFVQADSLSGSTNATAYLQIAAPGTSNYVTVETIVIDGVLTTSRKTGYYSGASPMRLRVIAPSGTQSTKVKASAVFYSKLD